ncbi:MAG: two-component system response regulator CreB [Pseudomonadota bacterium]
MTGARVLLVEDDPAIARSIIFALERDGLTVTHCLLLSDARQQLKAQAPDVLVLDVGLPDGSGLDLCRELRSGALTSEGSLPVLMLSAHGEEIDRVLGLELGADDYVTKPFSPRELLARVRGMLRRTRMAAPSSRARPATPFDMDIEGQRVSLHGKALNLTRREFGLLADLLTHRGRIRSRDDLLGSVWGADSDSTDRTVDTHIKTLRAKLLAASPGHDYIVTHRGMGYAMET